MQKLTLGLDGLPPDLEYFVNEAKTKAEQLPSPQTGRAGLDEANVILSREMVNLGIQVQRDRSAQRSIAGNLAEVLAEALLLEYDISDVSLQKTLLSIAVLMHTSGYTPMRVLGATGEAFKK